MPSRPDFTKLGWFDKTIDLCTVVSLPAGATPKFIKVRLPGSDGAIIDAWWTGIPDLAVASTCSLRYSAGLQAQYTVSGGGTGTAPPSSHTHPATDISLNTSNFDNNLDSTITDVQLLADAVDELATATPHDLLSSTHSDTNSGAVVAGDIIVGNATPEWARLPIGSEGEVLTVVSGTAAWAANAGSGLIYMPLTTVVAGEPVLVWDDDNNLIPTGSMY